MICSIRVRRRIQINLFIDGPNLIWFNGGGMMDSKTHSAVFKPRARLLELLGEQLIRDHRIALFELVKNSYDADSPAVTLHFHNILNPACASIEIIDSGEGMDLETVLNVWLEPASEHKAEKRKRGERSPIFDRLPIGEKGVGRFAVHKLGNRVLMVTRRKGHPEIKVSLDWRQLTSSRYLSDAPILVVEREPEIFLGDRHGTFIGISGLKTGWTRGDIRRLYRAVSAMVSPFENKDPFSINFVLDPETEDWLKDLFSPGKAEEAALYEFTFFLDDNSFRWRYRYTPYSSIETDFKDIVKPRSVGSENEIKFDWFALEAPEGKKWRGRSKRPRTPSLKNLGIGPISGRILGFDLDKELIPYIGESVGLKEYLQEQGGIRVYRDGMRVYDYGEPDNDWLGLDERRFQQPVKRLSNNLVLGEIRLDLSSSQGLEEKTNREGFIENKAYLEFRYAVQCVLARFETERSKDKTILRRALDERKKGRITTSSIGPEEAIQALRKKILEEGLHEKLNIYVDRIEKSYKDARDVLMSAVGSGLGLSMVFHEIERGVRGLLRSLETGAAIDKVLEMARSLSDLLQGAAWMVRTNRNESFRASEIVKAAIFSIQPRFKFHGVSLMNGFDNASRSDFDLKGSRRMLVASLVNLLDNALHWVKVREGGPSSTKKPCVWIGPGDSSEGRSIIVADSGTGFEDLPEDVVKPFFTRRFEGMGLGLYYVDMTMKAHKGRIAFPNRSDADIPRVCDGAIVAMIFPERKENS